MSGLVLRLDIMQAPQIRRAMLSVLHRCQTKLGSWVGSSVVHLGDHNVPNALMFIDKVSPGFDGNSMFIERSHNLLTFTASYEQSRVCKLLSGQDWQTPCVHSWL